MAFQPANRAHWVKITAKPRRPGGPFSLGGALYLSMYVVSVAIYGQRGRLRVYAVHG